MVYVSIRNFGLLSNAPREVSEKLGCAKGIAKSQQGHENLEAVHGRMMFDFNQDEQGPHNIYKRSWKVFGST